MRVLLGISLLQQRAPVLISSLGVNKDQLPVDGRQSVIDNNINPDTVSPKPKVEDSLVSLWLLSIPFLNVWFRNNL